MKVFIGEEGSSWSRIIRQTRDVITKDIKSKNVMLCKI